MKIKYLPFGPVVQLDGVETVKDYTDYVLSRTDHTFPVIEGNIVTWKWKKNDNEICQVLLDKSASVT